MKKYLLLVIALITLLAGCSEGEKEKESKAAPKQEEQQVQRVNEKEDHQSENSEKEDEKNVSDEEKQEAEVKHFISYSSEGYINEFKKAFSEQDFDFKLIEGDKMAFTLSSYYPKERINISEITKFALYDDGLTAVDGYTAYEFIDGSDKEPGNDENIFILTDDEVEFANKLILKMATGYRYMGVTEEEMLRQYIPTKENFINNEAFAREGRVAAAYGSELVIQDQYILNTFNGRADYNPEDYKVDIEGYLKFSEEVFDDRQNMDGLEDRMIGDELYSERYNALHYVTTTDYDVRKTEHTITEMKLLRSTLRPMVTFYTEMAEYYGENPDEFLNEESTVQTENTYNTFISKLERQLEIYKQDQIKVKNSKWEFLLK